jgi:hypothetical protein
VASGASDDESARWSGRGQARGTREARADVDAEAGQAWQRPLPVACDREGVKAERAPSEDEAEDRAACRRCRVEATVEGGRQHTWTPDAVFQKGRRRAAHRSGLGQASGVASASAVDVGAQDERLTDDGRQGLHLWPREDDVGRHLGEVGVRAVHGGHRVSSGSSGRREG